MGQEMDADVITPDEVRPRALADYDLIGFGSGIYFMLHHPSMLSLAARLPQTKTNAFVFSTSGAGKTLLHVGLRTLLKRSGLRIVDEFACKGFEGFSPGGMSFGRNQGLPNESDLSDARAFVRAL